MITRNGQALILGLGRFGGGREAARFLHRRGWALRIADRARADSLADAVSSLGELDRVDWCLGREDERLLDGIDLVVVNPAIPIGHPLVAAAERRRVPLTQEVELFLGSYPGRVVCVTGTNGKSTTTTLIARGLLRAGRSALAGGNIGRSLLAEEPRWQADQTAVLEVSSAQLARLDPAARPFIGTVSTVVTSDHLDWHGSLDAYRAAKERAASGARDFVVHAADDAVAAGFATSATRLVHARTERADADADVDRHGFYRMRRHPDPGPILHRDALHLLGEFQADNVLGASLALAALGVPRHVYATALAHARPLPHRLQEVAELRGVRVFDNGVSTGLQSTLSAVASIRGPVHWVGGGKDKGGNLDRVAAALGPRLASAHLFGDSAAPLRAAFTRATNAPVTAQERLEEALDAALRAAAPGSAVLFSPGFTSFDQYWNFEARANAFEAWLRAEGGN